MLNLTLPPGSTPTIQPYGSMMIDEQKQLNTSEPKDAITIIDNLFQPGTKMDRRLWRIAEECIETIKNALNKPAQE